ncbi:RNA-dependent RNA polymerase [Colletotrichum navitas totivirus 1]|nr:RNA-dependent RNA polymerase [Colletotrichum navitas totivirus 1]
MSKRVGEFGALGVALDRVITDTGFDRSTFSKCSDSTLAAMVESSIPALARLHPALPSAVSLLLLEFPLQLPFPLENTGALLNLAMANVAPSKLIKIRKFNSKIKKKNGETRSGEFRAYELYLREIFPYKSNAAAATKCSVSLSRLIKSALSLYPASFVYGSLRLPVGTTYDQAVASLLYACGLHVTIGVKGAQVSAALVGDPGLAKGLSGALKALGCNSTRLGSILTEANALQGRGVGAIDLLQEAIYRCDEAEVAKKVINVPDNELRRHVKEIISSELKRKPEFEDTEVWWSRRWQWCVNGTENSLSDSALKLDSRRWKATHTRAYRKMAAEAVEIEPTNNWDGVTLVSVSPKLEHGKTRAIFACDTLSYFAFARLLDPVQKVWANRRVLLDPGGRGMTFLARKINHGRAAGGVNLMLDYDDFNSQHTTRAMQIVFEELGRLVDYPEDSLRVLVKSFETTYVSCPDGSLRRSVGTLMSGHRATTFINSILNAAYIRWALGAQRFDSTDSMHTGDDVYILANTLPDALDILRKCQAAGCRMNPSKQSLGRHSAEFLRCAVGPHGAYGYLARAIGSVSCGSWIDPSPVVAFEGLRNGMALARALINRSGLQAYGTLLADAWKDRTYAPFLRKLFSGEASLDGSPSFSKSEVIPVYTSRLVEAPPDTGIGIPPGWGTAASRAYLASHVSPVEQQALSMARIDPLPMLVSLSHQRGLVKPKGLGSGRIVLERGPDIRPRGHAYAFELFNLKADEGVLGHYPLINLVSGRLSKGQLRMLVSLAGGDGNAPDIQVEAFGPKVKTHRVVGTMPYSDASALSKVSDAGVIHASLNVAL